MVSKELLSIPANHTNNCIQCQQIDRTTFNIHDDQFPTADYSDENTLPSL